jgi:hypothetical protein
MFGGSVHTTTKNTEALAGGSEEVGLAVNVDKTNCIFLSVDQNARQNHNKG